MSYHRNPEYWSRKTRVRGNAITFCSCVMVGTQVEQTQAKREIVMMWARDVAAGAGIVLFMVSAFALASGAQVFLAF